MKTNISKLGTADLVVDNVLRNVVDGKSSDINYLEKDVVNNGFIRLLIQTGSGIKMHFKVTVVSEGKSYFKSFVNGSYSGGTLPDDDKLTVIKRNATKSYQTKITPKYNPTISDLGEQRGNLLVLGGTGPQSTGGTTGTSESIVGENSEFLLELQNVSGQSKDMSLVIELYEEEI